MNISPAIGNIIGTVGLQMQKHAPVILTTVGIAGVVTSGVLAARATLKLERTVDMAQARLDHARGTEQSKTRAYAANVLDMVKLYGPPVSLGVVSLVCIVSAQNILHKRNAALALAYKGLEETVHRYRTRVSEALGEEKERDLWLGLKDEEFVDEKGKKHKVKTLEDDAAYGPTSFLFGPLNVNWQGTPEFNEYFLNSMESVLNNLLQHRGHVFLNEVLDKLGMERTQEGAVLGWIRDKKVRPDGTAFGGGFIDFHAVRLDSPMAMELEYPDRGSWILDFNVDGYIWDEI